MRMIDPSAHDRRLSARPPALFTRVRHIVVFTSIEGASFEERALSRLDRDGVRLVPVTVMTLNEIEAVVNALPTVEIMIIEAGGAIARRRGGHWSVEACGPDAEALLGVIAEIEERSGASLLVHSVLPGSTRRHFSEPFAIETGDLGEVVHAAESIGYSVRRGPRFLHLSRKSDEGMAFERVKRELACDVTIGVGSSPADAEFLRRADVPIILAGPDGADLDLLHQVPNASIVSDGWSDGVRRALDELARPRRRAGVRPAGARR